MKNRIMYIARTGFYFAVLLLIALAIPVRAGKGNADNPKVLPPQSNPGGKSYGEWGAEWWKWAYAFPADKNPIQDPTGQYGALGQSGSVWFLAGTFGQKVERSLTIPSGKMIFFPLANIFNDYPCPDPAFQPGPGQTLEEFLAEGAKWYVDQVSAMSVEVDGVALKNLWGYRAASGLTTFTGDPSWASLDPCITGEAQFGVSDGYWIMLAPLTPGGHDIHFTAEEKSLGWSLDVTYHLMVKRGNSQ